MGWITNVDQDDEAKKILWLTGPAGTGKTAIAGSITEMCDELDLLAGGFFFASFAASESRRSKRCLVATLAYDLILPLDDDHPFRRAVIAAILRDPSVFCRRLKDQLRVVLVKPLFNTRHQFDAATLPKVFVLDGLNEVQALNSGKLDKHGARLANETDQEEILLALLSASNDPAFPFRIVVASRPERVIRNFFSTYANHATKENFLDEKYDPDPDITLFLVPRFAEFRRRYRLPLSWPSEKDIQRLVNTASGQFIYAATVVRFLEGGSHPNPRDLLEAILSCRYQAQAVSALAPLDVLYTGIIMSSPDPLLAFRWLIVIDADHNAPASFVNQLLQDSEGQLEADYLLENLTSLIRMPPAEDHPSPYELYHKCLVSFLLYQGLSDQEMAETLESSLTFYLKRCTDVMIRKSPAVPLQEPQESDFIYRFPELDDRRNICYFTCHAPFNQQGLRALSECDVVWWVHRAILSQGTRRGERRISRWFEQVHKKMQALEK
ncbi:hypothetical protein FA13DRAFT_527798 [Coprinellus micaceus]|uniref:Nephrocystin 3-like N-terminal domain-containing protein n=1 Tax=Coprinellus micaceus TaxID=71717 RepID=A0A4Y7T9B5_COPMI|nr:hypothetical protein FA13DRAFT_527798 [Coprinellus micaceus]